MEINITPKNPDVYTGDIGITFLSTIYNQNDEIVPLESATSIIFRFKNPEDTSIDKTGVFVTNGSDGKVKYVADDMFDIVGTWKYQIVITFPSAKFHTNIVEFKVYASIPAEA